MEPSDEVQMTENPQADIDNPSADAPPNTDTDRMVVESSDEDDAETGNTGETDTGETDVGIESPELDAVDAQHVVAHPLIVQREIPKWRLDFKGTLDTLPDLVLGILVRRYLPNPQDFCTLKACNRKLRMVVQNDSKSEDILTVAQSANVPLTVAYYLLALRGKETIFKRLPFRNLCISCNRGGWQGTAIWKWSDETRCRLCPTCCDNDPFALHTSSFAAKAFGLKASDIVNKLRPAHLFRKDHNSKLHPVYFRISVRRLAIQTFGSISNAKMEKLAHWRRTTMAKVGRALGIDIKGHSTLVEQYLDRYDVPVGTDYRHVPKASDAGLVDFLKRAQKEVLNRVEALKSRLKPLGYIIEIDPRTWNRPPREFVYYPRKPDVMVYSVTTQPIPALPSRDCYTYVIANEPSLDVTVARLRAHDEDPFWEIAHLTNFLNNELNRWRSERVVTYKKGIRITDGVFVKGTLTPTPAKHQELLEHAKKGALKNFAARKDCNLETVPFTLRREVEGMRKAILKKRATKIAKKDKVDARGERSDPETKKREGGAKKSHCDPNEEKRKWDASGVRSEAQVKKRKEVDGADRDNGKGAKRKRDASSERNETQTKKRKEGARSDRDNGKGAKRKRVVSVGRGEAKKQKAHDKAERHPGAGTKRKREGSLEPGEWSGEE
ncbi:hypothetical protein M427DRAFT_51486, partial [Gonapodya prolifera JEL478]